jgi:hypothetical protein
VTRLTPAAAAASVIELPLVMAAIAACWATESCSGSEASAEPPTSFGLDSGPTDPDSDMKNLLLVVRLLYGISSELQGKNSG